MGLTGLSLSMNKILLVSSGRAGGKTLMSGVALAAYMAAHPDCEIIPVADSSERLKDMVLTMPKKLQAPEFEEPEPTSPRDWGMSRACQRMVRKGHKTF